MNCWFVTSYVKDSISILFAIYFNRDGMPFGCILVNKFIFLKCVWKEKWTLNKTVHSHSLIFIEYLYVWKIKLVKFNERETKIIKYSLVWYFLWSAKSTNRKYRNLIFYDKGKAYLLYNEFGDFCLLFEYERKLLL